MRFFKTKSALELLWFDGHELAVDPVPRRVVGNSVLVLITNDETCKWQQQPSLVFWQHWIWRRALFRRARDQRSVQQSNRYYAMPVMRRWQGQRVYLQQQWEPHRKNLSPNHAISTRLQSQLDSSQGLYSFNQWWLAWCSKSQLGSILNKQSVAALQVIHLQVSPTLWVQVAHYHQQACWWRPINVREEVHWSYEYQRFVDFLSLQPLLKAISPSCLVWVDKTSYVVIPNIGEVDPGLSVEVTLPERSMWQSHECDFDSHTVLQSLASHQPAYAVQPWYQQYGLQKRQAKLMQFNAWLLSLVFLLTATLPLWKWTSIPNQVGNVVLDEPLLNRQQQQALEKQLEDFNRHYTAHKNHYVNDYAEQVWQRLSGSGMVIKQLEWRWQTTGYWQWSLQAELRLSDRHALPSILENLEADLASYGKIEHWQADISGFEPVAGRIMNPQQQQIHVNWQWQLWP